MMKAAPYSKCGARRSFAAESFDFGHSSWMSGMGDLLFEQAMSPWCPYVLHREDGHRRSSGALDARAQPLLMQANRTQRRGNSMNDLSAHGASSDFSFAARNRNWVLVSALFFAAAC